MKGPLFALYQRFRLFWNVQIGHFVGMALPPPQEYQAPPPLIRHVHVIARSRQKSSLFNARNVPWSHHAFTKTVLDITGGDGIREISFVSIKFGLCQ